MNHCSIYITAPDQDTARTIARTIVEERLAACANILAPITAVYRWDGEVQEEGEIALIAKTTETLMPALIARVTAIHPYRIPCIVAWPITAGYQSYLDWISAETQPQS